MPVTHVTTNAHAASAVDIPIAATQSKKLYDTHIPVPTRQKIMLAVGSAFAALANPLRGGMCYIFIDISHHAFMLIHHV